MSTWLTEGQEVPDIRLQADDGRTISLKDLRGSPVVVYFYPRDDTPGCTREACAFRDRKSELQKLGVQVVGISTDDVRSHGKFRDKYELNFPLLADVEHRAAEAFGAWQEKNMYGRKSWGVVRSTFLVDADGVVRRVWRSVKVDGHDEAVLEAVRALDEPTASTAVAKPTKRKSSSTATSRPTKASRPAKKKK